MKMYTRENFQSLASPAICVVLDYYDETKQISGDIPRFGWNNVHMCQLLGEGAFSNVFLAEQNNNQQYALKCLNPKKIQTTPHFMTAVFDLSYEAKLLSTLKHKHIIELRGVSNEGLSVAYKSKENQGGYFILMQVLHETLKDRINKWKKESSTLRSLSRTLSGGRGGLSRTLSGTGSKLKPRSSLSRPPGASRRQQTLRDPPTIPPSALSKQEARRDSPLSSSARTLDNSWRRPLILPFLGRRDSPLSSSARTLDSSWRRSLTSKDAKLSAKMRARIKSVALPIASAMEYLHSQQIVLRDLKPANIGFDEEGQVRLYDFGMARPLAECKSREIVGTIRYMAPEIMEGRAYGLHSDIYSFGVLLWELCALIVPFEEFTTFEQFSEEVGANKVRPPINKIPCDKSRQLLQDCWDSDSDQRPKFEQIGLRLSDILTCDDEDDNQNYDDEPTELTSRKGRRKGSRLAKGIKSLDDDFPMKPQSCSFGSSGVNTEKPGAEAEEVSSTEKACNEDILTRSLRIGERKADSLDKSHRTAEVDVAVPKRPQSFWFGRRGGSSLNILGYGAEAPAISKTEKTCSETFLTRIV